MRFAAFVALLVSGIAILVLVPLPSPQELRDWVADAGAWAPSVFVAGYVVATVLLLPKNVLSAAAGLAFGLGGGIAWVWIAAVLGASLSFWLGRRLGRDGVARIAGRHLARLDGLVLTHGAAAILIARLIPVVPFTAVNYGSGLTAVPFRAYLVATAVGIVPGTVAYVSVGAYGSDPSGWRFLTASAVLVALSAAGYLVMRRRGRPSRAPAPPSPPPHEGS